MFVSAYPFADPDAIDRFVAKMTLDGACWIWTSAHDGRGYGAFRMYRKQHAAHRLSYRWATGREIPAGLQIDHLCRRPLCVNPTHLEVVTPRLNVRRSLSPPADNARKTHCLRAHAFTVRNTSIRRDGSRRCRKCQAIEQRERFLENPERVRAIQRESARRRRARRANAVKETTL